MDSLRCRHEKTGVPVEMLRCVQRVVEIPQLGHTRSLNVHVAAALVIFAATKQLALEENHEAR